jgi:hypothetical protein
MQKAWENFDRPRENPLDMPSMKKKLLEPQTASTAIVKVKVSRAQSLL